MKAHPAKLLFARLLGKAFELLLGEPALLAKGELDLVAVVPRILAPYDWLGALYRYMSDASHGVCSLLCLTLELLLVG